jgi:hypothetical protein
LKLKYDKLLSSFAFKFNLRHYTMGLIAGACQEGVCGLAAGYPEGTSRYCFQDGVMCKGMCAEGKLCEMEADAAYS